MKKVCIVGLGLSRINTPYDDKEFEIWGLNDSFSILKRCDRLFQIHKLEDIKDMIGRYNKTNVIEELKSIKIPIYMQQVFDDIPSSVKYPLKEVSNGYHQLFSCCISYMIALAIYENFEEILICGVELANDEEYTNQLPSVLYWLGIAEGKGIKVIISENCCLLNRIVKLYGYET